MPIQTKKHNRPSVHPTLVQAIRYEYYINRVSYTTLSERFSLSRPLIIETIKNYKHVTDSIPAHVKENRKPKVLGRKKGAINHDKLQQKQPQ
jgi:hypothetical protein